MNQTIRRMNRYFNVDCIMRLSQNKELRKELQIRRLSRYNRVQKKSKVIRFGIKVSNNVREALILDKENGNNLWDEAIKKEMAALNQASVFIYHPPSYKVSHQYQYAWESECLIQPSFMQIMLAQSETQQIQAVL